MPGIQTVLIIEKKTTCVINAGNIIIYFILFILFELIFIAVVSLRFPFGASAQATTAELSYLICFSSQIV